MPPGPPVMMHLQLVARNVHKVAAHQSDSAFTPHQAPGSGACPAGTVPGSQALRKELLAKFRATSVPWGPEGQRRLTYPREEGPRSGPPSQLL